MNSCPVYCFRPSMYLTMISTSSLRWSRPTTSPISAMLFGFDVLLFVTGWSIRSQACLTANDWFMVWVLS